MANFKVKENKKRIMSAYSIQKDVKEQFGALCAKHEISASRKLENIMKILIAQDNGK